MAEEARASFVKYSVTRAPGKRQIKPTAAFSELVITGDDDDDDQEFELDKKSSNDSGSDSEGSSGSSSGSDQSGSSDSEVTDSEELDPNEIDDLKREVDEMNNGQEAPLKNPQIQKVLVCSICLNLREVMKGEEVIQCDKCGLCVHEACYGTDLGDDVASNHSTSSTEPWFCEPCLYGLIEPPFCELCPNRYGAFKRTDIGGQWIHLICALYTPGCTFGDAEKLTAISTMEIDYSKHYGRKACSGCSSRLDARVGIATECDAAMCKQFFHPTCAQRLGLLISNEEANTIGNSEETVYIHCKKHSQEEVVRRKKLAYARFHLHEERRMIGLKRRKLSEREERFRKRNLERLMRTHKQLEGVTICWPGAQFDKNDMKQRRIRPLQTSMRIVEGLADKAESNYGITKEDFEKEFFKVRGERLPFLPPGFSPEFVAYFNNREKNVLANEQKKLETLNEQNKVLREQMNRLEHSAQKIDEEEKQLDASLKRFQKLFDALTKLGVKKLQNPFLALIKERKGIGKLKKKPSTGSAPTSPAGSPAMKRPTLNECKECGKQTDQHLLIECDQCHAFYHIRCLDPPLEKMPKKTNFDWHCSDCISDSEDEEEKEESEQSDEDAPRKLKLRERSDASKARKMQQQEDQRRAYRSAMQNARQKPTKGSQKNGSHSKAKDAKKRKRQISESTASLSGISVQSPVSRPSSKSSKGSPEKKSPPKKSPRIASPSPKKGKLTGCDSILKGRQVYVSDNGLPAYYDSDVSEEFCLLD